MINQKFIFADQQGYNIISYIIAYYKNHEGNKIIRPGIPIKQMHNLKKRNKKILTKRLHNNSNGSS